MVELIAEDGQRCAMRRLERYARASGVRARRGPGWTAVLTGVSSNDMNGVVSEGATELDEAQVAELVAWCRASGVPASWCSSRSSTALTASLLRLGARPERTGSWIGGPAQPMAPAEPMRPQIEVRRVSDDVDLDGWLDVAGACGWLDDARDRRARRSLYRSLGLDDFALVHWVAVFDGRVAGMASSFHDGDVVDLCNLAVLPPDRRRGIATALVDARLRHAAAAGATRAVSAVSPEGWKVYRPRPFHSVPVTPDVTFYLPVDEV